MMRTIATRSVLALVLIFFMACTLNAQSNFTEIYTFNPNQGAHPSSIVQGINGNFYGLTAESGAHYYGTLFEITAGGTLKVLYDFCSKGNCTDGGGGGFLVLGGDGTLYGATREGGNINNCAYVNYGCGTVFKVTPGGVLTTLHRFCSAKNCADGWAAAGLIATADGSLYGTTFSGGLHQSGTIFQITGEGKFITLYNFCSQTNCTDGLTGTGMIQAANGSFYGTTEGGGSTNYGAVFKMTPAGAYEVLASFDGTNGAQPMGGIVQASDGNLYGTAWSGGAVGAGTIFKASLSGTLSLLYSFCSQSVGDVCTDGESPTEPLIFASDGNLYGTTPDGGNRNVGDGVAFQIAAAGAESTIHDFCSSNPPLCTDGTIPGELTQSTSGLIYGATEMGGKLGFGTIYTLDLGLPPFVKSLPFIGNAGSSVTILGSNLTGATAVSFNGTTASFQVVSPSEITAIVPAGATTGKISVTTPQNVLSTSVDFNVTR
jgi:uncharacterized repeat protein (TIGR03803 family)